MQLGAAQVCYRQATSTLGLGRTRVVCAENQRSKIITSNIVCIYLRAVLTIRKAAVAEIAPRMLRNALPRFYTSATHAKPDFSRVPKFWEHIDVKVTSSGRLICMDGKPMKSPGGNHLEVPHYKPEALSELISQEWRVLPSLKLKSHMVPLTSLAGRSIDILPEQREEALNKLMPYLDTDTLVVLSPKKDCNGELRAAQEALYPHIIEDACQVWNVPYKNIRILDTEVSLFGNYQTEETKVNVRKWIQSLDNWQFASFERATTAAKSLIIGMNIVLGKRPVSELAMLSSLDIIHQTALWGEVEDTHDVDRADLHRLLGAAYINAIEKL